MRQANLSIQNLAIQAKQRVHALTGKYEQLPEYTDGLIGQFCLAGCAVNADKDPVPALPADIPQSPMRESQPVQATPQQPDQLQARMRPPQVPSVEEMPSQITGRDGAPMELIPAGSFLMGNTKGEVDQAIHICLKELKQDQQSCESDLKPELPQHKVQIDAFYLDKYEVTNRLFQQFVTQTGYQTTGEKEGSAIATVGVKEGLKEIKGANWQRPGGATSVFQSHRENHPVVAVSWDDAEAYCRWAVKRLPTEAEFEYAMRAGTRARYWWGQGDPGTRRVENVADNNGVMRTAPVGSYEANPWGLYDINGNVAEWTKDWYDANYFGRSQEHNPQGPSAGEYRVVRGGAWNTGGYGLRSTYREPMILTNRVDFIGFRCAQDFLK